MPASHSQTLTTGFGLTGDQESGIYRPTVPGLQPTTTGREPSALPNLTDRLYTDEWRTKYKPLIGYRIGT